MRFASGLMLVPLLATLAVGEVYIDHNPNVADGGLNVAPPGVWVKVGDGPDAQLDDDRDGMTPDDGGDWMIGGSDGTGSSPRWDLYYGQTFTVPAAGEYVVNLSGWAKAWAGWWGGENWNWVQEAHIMLYVDGELTADMFSSNNTNRDEWKFWSYSGTVNVNSTLEVRLRAVKGNDQYNAGALGAIFFNSRFDDIRFSATPVSACTNPVTFASISPSALLAPPYPGPTQFTITGTNLDQVVGVQMTGPVSFSGSVVSATPTQLIAEIDLTAGPIGAYDLVLLRDPASDCPPVHAPEVFSYAAGPLYNGGFELGDPGDPNDIPGWTFKVFTHTGWGLPAPRLAKLGMAGELAAPEGNFLAGSSVEGNGNYHVGLYQTFATTPGVRYRVSGWYGGVLQDSADTGWWEVRLTPGLVDDPELEGLIIAKQERLPNGGQLHFAEEFNGEFVATDSLMTIFLKHGRMMSDNYRYVAAGFDNIVITPACNVPFADTNTDGDVDQEDFGKFQECFSGDRQPLNSEDGYCTCLDRDLDGDVDQADFGAFQNCATGPGLIFDANVWPDCVP